MADTAEKKHDQGYREAEDHLDAEHSGFCGSLGQVCVTPANQHVADLETKVDNKKERNVSGQTTQSLYGRLQLEGPRPTDAGENDGWKTNRNGR